MGWQKDNEKNWEAIAVKGIKTITNIPSIINDSIDQKIERLAGLKT